MIMLDLPPHEVMIIEQASKQAGMSVNDYIRSKVIPTEQPFNYDLERMKDRVENQEFVSCPDDVQSPDDFRKWLQGIAQS